MIYVVEVWLGGEWATSWFVWRNRSEAVKAQQLHEYRSGRVARVALGK